MELLTEESRRQIPPLYTTEGQDDPIVWVKLFTPWTSWTWYVTEFDGDDTLFGWVDGEFPEMGYTSLSEIQEVTGPFGLKVERDLHFRPCRLSRI
jgi:hypothetical protein